MHINNQTKRAAGMPAKGGQRLWDAFARCGAIAVATGFLLWVFYNVLYAVPGADDFCYGWGAQLRGLFGNVVHEYFRWTGRFSATFAIGVFSVSPAILLNHTYLAPGLILAGILLASLHWLRSLELGSRSMLLIFFTLVVAMFRMRDSIFWISGAATYGIAAILMLALIAELYRFFVLAVTPSWQRVVVLSLVSVIFVGFNETSMLAYIVMLGLVCVDRIVSKTGRIVVRVLIASLLGAVVAIAAPGNFLRPSPVQPGVFWAALLALKLLFIKYTLPFLVSLLLFGITFSLFSRTAISAVSSRRLKWFALILFCGLWAGIFARTYVLNELGPERARTIDYVLINCAAFCIARQWHAKKMMSSSSVAVWPGILVSASLVLLLAAMVVSPDKTWKAWVADARESVALHQLMMQRFDFVASTRQDSYEVEGYFQKIRPITYFGDIKADPTQWENQCFSEYFRIKSIHTIASSQ